jgi:hypothetical protein
VAQFLVTTPIAGYTGEVGKVHFADGVALIDDETDAATLAYCRAAGYTVEASDDPEPDGDEPDGDDAEQPKKSASTEAWRAWAVEHGGLEADEAATLSRDQLVERFTTSTEETPA